MEKLLALVLAVLTIVTIVLFLLNLLYRLSLSNFKISLSDFKTLVLNYALAYIFSCALTAFAVCVGYLI